MPVPGLSLLGLKHIRGFVSILRYINPTIIIIIIKRIHCRRHLVPPGKQVAYQLPRTQGSLSSLTRVPRPLYAQYSTYRNRQHHSGVIHKQGRRHEVGPTLCFTLENLDLVRQKSSNSKSPTQAG